MFLTCIAWYIFLNRPRENYSFGHFFAPKLRKKNQGNIEKSIYLHISWLQIYYLFQFSCRLISNFSNFSHTEFQWLDWVLNNIELLKCGFLSFFCDILFPLIGIKLHLLPRFVVPRVVRVKHDHSVYITTIDHNM